MAVVVHAPQKHAMGGFVAQYTPPPALHAPFDVIVLSVCKKYCAHVPKYWS